ncbi:hypothetical protein QMK33_18700 [Hymenobacter sp. H14-R3]|uniref:hypothetical protein n=1 Tax=Hymenobacter sp. H14-R3 TaxID=3046308 RepID=UPI0024B9A3B6|nr:hypothetical protein [Hymenobacter sp. H14-R3]MDJ0367183.1 hypothetical protein [Hymenobacter sp. H14-R3]
MAFEFTMTLLKVQSRFSNRVVRFVGAEYICSGLTQRLYVFLLFKAAGTLFRLLQTKLFHTDFIWSATIKKVPPVLLDERREMSLPRQ